MLFLNLPTEIHLYINKYIKCILLYSFCCRKILKIVRNSYPLNILNYVCDVNDFKIALNIGGYKFNTKTFNIVACGGNIECLKIMYESGYRITQKIVENIVKYGHLDALKWIIDNIQIKGHSKIHSHRLFFYNGHSNTFSHSLFFHAASNCHYHILKFLLNPNEGFLFCSPDHDIICGAAKSGSIEMLNWSCNNFRWTKDACKFAIIDGHVHVMDWIMKQNYEMETSTKLYMLSIYYNKPKIFEWLVIHGYYLDKNLKINE